MASDVCIIGIQRWRGPLATYGHTMPILLSCMQCAGHKKGIAQNVHVFASVGSSMPTFGEDPPFLIGDE
ncbi:MAG: hypothetical protein IMW89_21655 [Ktedonobacteraceae bacterium]|nr:hypothetical protein [Ktedonobacteraceae bacterium]